MAKYSRQKSKTRYFGGTIQVLACRAEALRALSHQPAADLKRDGKLTNETGLKLVRETCAAIGETHGKLAASRAESILRGAVEEFIRIGGGEFTSYTVRSWFNTWIDGRTDASKATQGEYRRIIEMFLTHLGTRSDRALPTLERVPATPTL